MLVATVLLCAACSGLDLPSGLTGPGLFVSASFPADTIDARSVAELEVIAYGANGSTLPGVTVTFTPENMFMAGTPAQEPWIGETSRVTGSDGKASIRFKRGDHTPVGRIILSMTDSTGRSFADTATFQILPGHTVSGHTASPRDTALYIGRAFQFSAGGVDRNGNAVPIGVTYTHSAGVDVTSTGVVTTTDYGRNFVVASSLAGVDTAWVSVLPHGTLSGVFVPSSQPPGPSTQFMDLDGSNRQAAPWPDADATLWTPDGQHFLVFNEFALWSMQIVDLQGNAHRFGPDSLDHASGPSFSGDRSKVVFRRFKDGYFTLWRADADGTNVIQAVPFFVQEAAASFDGSLVAAVTGFDSLRVYSVPDGTPGAWTRLATQPRWSPDGKWIAIYLDRQNLGVIVDAVSGETLLQFGDAGPRTWSPDSQWLLTNHDLVHVPDGRMIPLPASLLNSTIDSWKTAP
jgi:hypothetical protein